MPRPQRAFADPVHRVLGRARLSDSGITDEEHDAASTGALADGIC